MMKRELKQCYLRHVLFFVCLMMTGLDCDKSLDFDLNGGGEDPILEGSVVERGTNTPVSGANVELQACSKYDIEFGCVEHKTVGIATTDANGSFKFRTSLRAERYIVTHPHYWDETADNLYVTLTPEAFARVHLKKVNTYRDTLGMSLYVARQGAWIMFPQWTGIGYLPNDTMILLKAYGNLENVIHYYYIREIDTEQVTPPLYFNGFDTTDVEIDY